MQASLHQFLPDPGPIVDRTLEAAGHGAIIAEPIRNVTSALGRLSALLTDPGTGPPQDRFDAERLRLFFAAYGPMVVQEFALPGGRERAYVLGTDGGAAGRRDDASRVGC